VYIYCENCKNNLCEICTEQTFYLVKLVDKNINKNNYTDDNLWMESECFDYLNIDERKKYINKYIAEYKYIIYYDSDTASHSGTQRMVSDNIMEDTICFWELGSSEYCSIYIEDDIDIVVACQYCTLNPKYRLYTDKEAIKYYFEKNNISIEDIKDEMRLSLIRYPAKNANE